MGKEHEERETSINCEVIEDDRNFENGSENDWGHWQLFNPTNNALDAVVAQYLGIKIPRAIAKLGNSDWGVKTISDLQRQYLKWDVEQLPALWAKLQTELETAKLSACFTERMKFFPNLHTIKMTGIPVHRALLGFRSGRSIHA